MPHMRWRNNFMGRSRVKPDDLPMIGTITRTGKGRYIVDIKFAKSRRPYDAEIVFAPNVKQAKAHILKLYPTIKWSK